MALFKGRKVGLLGTGMYVPEKVLTNEDLTRMVNTSDEWITERSGIKERRIVEEGQLTSDLAFNAGKAALDNSGISPEELDMVIVATNTPDTVLPGVAPKVQNLLGAKNAGANDIQAGCTGCVYAMTIATAGIASGLWNKVLVIGAEALSPLIDWTDRGTCVLFGDGAGAAVLGPVEEGRGIISASLKADGAGHDFIILPAGAAEMPASHETIEAREHFIKMKGNEVFKFVNRKIPPFLREVCNDSSISFDEIACWIFHQANLRIINGVLKRLKVDPGKAFVNLQKYGNTSAASVFLALHEAREEGRVTKGDLVLLTSFGAGMTYGALILEL